MPKDNTIGENLKKLLSERNIQQKELAYACDKTEATITRWINGTIQIPINCIQTICDTLQISSDELLNIKLKSNRGLYNMNISEKEKRIINAYRNDGEFRIIVDRVIR